MTELAVAVEVHRGRFLESVHVAHAVVADARGEIVEALGDPARVILPRSSLKPLQALPLVESGAAARARLGPERIALATASHGATPRHVALVGDWLAGLGLGDEALLCGAHAPLDRASRRAMAQAGETPRTLHNQCSGKHAGFLTLGRDLGAGPDYIDPDHPVQRVVRATLEEMAGEESPGHAVDGCSAPNFALSLRGFATALARLADPGDGARGDAARTIVGAMTRHPDLVSAPDHAVDRIVRAADRRLAVKSGAEGVFGAILPERGLGVALKIADGAERAAPFAIAGLLVRLGALGRDAAEAASLLRAPVLTHAGRPVGEIRAAI